MTLLVSSGVIMVTVLVVARVAFSDVNWPAATARRGRMGSPSIGLRPAPPRASGAVHADPHETTDLPGLRFYATRPTTLWARLRSGVLLVVLACALGGLVALAGVAVAVGAGIVVSGLR